MRKYKIHKRQNKLNISRMTMCGYHESEVRHIHKRWEEVNCKNCLKSKR